MPVITAAVVAIAAAVATTTVATVATAVVATSIAVGAMGAVVGGIGMAIGNKDLMFAGKVMGYVGLAGGLAGGVMGGLGAAMGAAGSEGLTFTQGAADAFAGASQHIENAWNSGIGGWFSGGSKIAGGVGEAQTAAKGAVGAAKGAPMSSPGNGMAAFPEVAESPTATLTPINEGVSLAPKAPITVGGGTPGAGTVLAPSTPGVGAPSIAGPGSTALQTATPGAGAAPSGGIVSSIGKSFSDMPDWMKYSMMTTGAQGLTGLASGYFQGKQAEVTAAQNQQVIDQNQAQRNLLNQQGNMVPELNFTKRF